MYKDSRYRFDTINMNIMSMAKETSQYHCFDKLEYITLTLRNIVVVVVVSINMNKIDMASKILTIILYTIFVSINVNKNSCGKRLTILLYNVALINMNKLTWQKTCNVFVVVVVSINLNKNGHRPVSDFNFFFNFLMLGQSVGGSTL